MLTNHAAEATISEPKRATLIAKQQRVTEQIQLRSFGSGCGWLFAVVFVGFWSLLTLTFDGFAGYAIVQQLRTFSFVEEQGIVLESRVVTNHDSDGDTYRPFVRYEYVIGDERFESEVVRYAQSSSSDSFAKDFVRAHPVDSPVAVFYSAANPQDSVLLRGLQGSDLFLPMFLIPFNLVMIGGWVFGLKSLQKPVPAPTPGPGVPVSDGRSTRTREDPASTGSTHRGRDTRCD